MIINFIKYFFFKKNDEIILEKQRLFGVAKKFNIFEDCIDEVFNGCDIYFQRLVNKNYFFNNKNTYFICLILSHKYTADDQYTMSTYIQVFRKDLKLKYVLDLELLCLSSLNYDLYKKQ